MTEDRDSGSVSSLSALSQLAGGMALDFNDVFTAILAHAEQLLAATGERLTPEEHAELIGILRAATRGADVVRKLRAFGRQESLRLVPVPLGRTITDFLKTVQRLVTDLQILLHVDDGLPLVRADIGAVEAILRQLLANAHDASDHTAPLKVTVQVRPGPAQGPSTDPSAPQRHVVVMLEDEGTGMSPLTLHHARDPYFTTKHVGEGSGLGLAMVDGLMHQMGGLLEIESHLGDGTTVTLHFPVMPAGELPSPERGDHRVPEVNADGNGSRVLVVEDDAAIRSLMARTLRGAGYSVVEAPDAEEAMTAIHWAQDHREPFALVVSDVVMPRGGGARVLTTMQEYAPASRLLWVTGFPSARHDGGGPPSADPVLEKPWTSGELLEAVRRALGGPPVGSSA